MGVDLTIINSESDVVSAINAVSNQTGVTASVETRVDLGTLDPAVAGTLEINDVQFTINLGDTAQSVVDQINADSTVGVTASLDAAGDVVITSTSGEDVVVDRALTRSLGPLTTLLTIKPSFLPFGFLPRAPIPSP